MNIFRVMENVRDTVQEWLMILLRPLLFIWPARITRRQALAIARAECERRGEPWYEPVRVLTRPHKYVVWTDSLSRGGSMFIDIDIHTGAIKCIRTRLRCI